MLKEQSALFLDVDQTLAGQLILYHLLIYNDFLNLGLDLNTMQECDGIYQSVFEVPEIKRYRNQGPDFEARFQSVRGFVRSTDIVSMTLQPTLGSQKMLRTLAERDDCYIAGYYTVRPHNRCRTG